MRTKMTRRNLIKVTKGGGGALAKMRLRSYLDDLVQADNLAIP